MILLTIVMYYAATATLWVFGWLAFYFLTQAKTDYSGDGGLAYGFVALLPFIWPWYLLALIRQK